ncbi:MAG: family 1 glycosylhydrolase [Terracidiphilus sp.]
MSSADRNVAGLAVSGLYRRELLRRASAVAAVGGMGKVPFAQSAASGSATAAQKGKTFPDRFLWGCATAGHQVEGNNTSSDFWAMEHLPQSMFKEPSGHACDHYHLYPQDIAMLADLGFNTYRFSLEWARIEPEEGFFSDAELEHYRRMLATCHEHQLTTMLTYSHFSIPRWFAIQGGWQNAKAADLYARFCEKATRHLGDLVGYASTLNEPDIPQLLNWFNLPGVPAGMSVAQMMQMGLKNVRKQLNAPEFADLFLGDAKKTRDGLLAAHAKGKDAMKSVRPDMPVGFNLAMTDDQPAPKDSHLEEKRADVYEPWLEAARHCDYLGVQTYSRSIVGKKDLLPPAGAELTQMGMEFYPECVEHVVRYAAKETGVPIYVTENGIATADDTRRVEYHRQALSGLKRAIDDGVDVRGYIAWSLLDNFEWMSGYTPKFGLVAVDLKTQKRTIKPSATLLGNIARNNAL